mmetsp:Transcript_6786/g.10602  ORF Transcript_6786/g.10602 Transcript_6786/m.10602 type:complete len:313 (+) Transcript_6786:78-1016(+)
MPAPHYLSSTESSHRKKTDVLPSSSPVLTKSVTRQTEPRSSRQNSRTSSPVSSSTNPSNSGFNAHPALLSDLELKTRALLDELRQIPTTNVRRSVSPQHKHVPPRFGDSSETISIPSLAEERARRFPSQPRIKPPQEEFRRPSAEFDLECDPIPAILSLRTEHSVLKATVEQVLREMDLLKKEKDDALRKAHLEVFNLRSDLAAEKAKCAHLQELYENAQKLLLRNSLEGWASMERKRSNSGGASKLPLSESYSWDKDNPSQKLSRSSIHTSLSLPSRGKSLEASSRRISISAFSFEAPKVPSGEAEKVPMG